MTTEDGPPLHGNTRVQATWITATTVIVLSVFVFGLVELSTSNGAGAGQGPSPIWKPGGTPLLVQVIGQQWRFTYRYPQFGGFETTQLVLPEGQWVAVQRDLAGRDPQLLGLPARGQGGRQPGVNNIAYTKPEHTGTVVVRCAELCGLWHGAMFDYGRVVSVAAFRAWAATTRVQLAAVTRILPPYATTYDPTVIPQINKAMAKAGIGGANGYYYPPQDPAQP